MRRATTSGAARATSTPTTPRALGLPNPFQAANWPNFTNIGLTSPTSTGTYPFGTAGLFWLVSNFGLFEDNATKIYGKHEFQFGVHIRDEWIGKSANSTAGIV